MCCTTLATGACSRSLSSNLWSGLSSPIVLPTDMPRTNVVTYCSLTSSPFSVRHSSRIAARVPFSSPWYPIILPRETSLSPGRIGRWKWKSCSPWTIRGISSTGITSTAGTNRAWNTGTIANTGGATSPLRWAAIGSLVAAAYSAIRSAVTSKRSSSLKVSRWLSSKLNSSSGIRGRHLGESGKRLVELLGAVLLDGLAQRTLDQRTLEVAGEGESRRAVAGRLKAEGERAFHPRHTGAAHREPAWRLDAVHGPLDLVGHAQHHDLGGQPCPFSERGRHLRKPLLMDGEPVRPRRGVGDHRPDRGDGCGQFAFGFDVSHGQLFRSAR